MSNKIVTLLTIGIPSALIARRVCAIEPRNAHLTHNLDRPRRNIHFVPEDRGKAQLGRRSRPANPRCGLAVGLH